MISDACFVYTQQGEDKYVFVFAYLYMTFAYLYLIIFKCSYLCLYLIRVFDAFDQYILLLLASFMYDDTPLSFDH